MTDYTELKRLAGSIHGSGSTTQMLARWREFEHACEPKLILALIAESERLGEDLEFEKSQCEATLQAHSKLIEATIRAEGERDQLKAENQALRREREGKVLCDLELFETLRDSANTEADEHRQCMATYRPLRQANLDSVVKKCDDLLAAMGKGEQS